MSNRPLVAVVRLSLCGAHFFLYEWLSAYDEAVDGRGLRLAEKSWV